MAGHGWAVAPFHVSSYHRTTQNEGASETCLSCSRWKVPKELVKLWLGADVVWPKLLIPLAKARHTETLVWCSEGYEELQDRSPLCPAQKESVRSKVDR